MQTSYILFPLLVLAIYAAAETYLMMRPIEGNVKLYYYWADEKPHLRPLPTTRYYVQQLASRLDGIMLAIVILFFESGFPIPQLFVPRNLAKRLAVASRLFFGLIMGLKFTSVFTGLLVSCFTSFSYWNDESPQKYIMDLIYVVTILSFGIWERKSIGSLIAIIGVISTAMIGIGCLATQALNVSLLDTVFCNFIGISVACLVFAWIEYYLLPIDTTNINARRNQPHQCCTCLRDDLSVSSGQERDQQPPSTISTVVQNFHEDFA